MPAIRTTARAPIRAISVVLSVVMFILCLDLLYYFLSVGTSRRFSILWSAGWGPKLNNVQIKVEAKIPASCDVQVLPSTTQGLLKVKRLGVQSNPASFWPDPEDVL